MLKSSNPTQVINCQWCAMRKGDIDGCLINGGFYAVYSGDCTIVVLSDAD